MKPRGLFRYWSCRYLKSQGFRNPLVGVWYTGPLEIKEGWSSWTKADATLIGTFVAIFRPRVGGYELGPVRTYYGRFISQWLIFCGLIRQVQRWGWRELIKATNIPKPMADSAPDIAYFFLDVFEGVIATYLSSFYQIRWANKHSRASPIHHPLWMAVSEVSPHPLCELYYSSVLTMDKRPSSRTRCSSAGSGLLFIFGFDGLLVWGTFARSFTEFRLVGCFEVGFYCLESDVLITSMSKLLCLACAPIVITWSRLASVALTRSAWCSPILFS